MDDDEYLNSLMSKSDKYEYHEICKWLPYKPETVDDISHDIVHNGYREDRPIMLFEGKILDGRHRYEATLKAGVEPSFMRFVGTRQEAIDFVTSENVNRRHLSNPEKEFFYVQRAEALGVRKREDSLKQNSTDPSNEGTAPTAKQNADALGVSRATVERWEDQRKEIYSDPDLSLKTDTFEGYKEAKKELKERKASMPVVPKYNVDEAMGAIKGISQMYGQQYEGTTTEASQVLLDRIMEGYDQDDVGLSIAKDYAKWFLSLKEVFDLVGPELEEFLADKPNLSIVN